MCEQCKKLDKVMEEELPRLRERFQPFEEESLKKLAEETNTTVEDVKRRTPSLLSMNLVQHGVAEAVRAGVGPRTIVSMVAAMMESGIAMGFGATREGEALPFSLKDLLDAPEPSGKVH